MTKKQPSIEHEMVLRQKVSIQERSVLVGDIIYVNGFNVDSVALMQRFAQGGYQVQETAHFLLFTRSETPKTVLVHRFSPQQMNADIKHYLVQELKPLGLLTKSQHFGERLCGIIGSFVPDDARLAWHGYGAKTLQRFLLYLSTAHTPPVFDFYATIGAFANWYQRVCELSMGESFLDAGCESGFLSLVIAERIPFMNRVVGVDIRPDMFPIASSLAEERGLHTVQFVQADLFADDLRHLGMFDTVTALAIIEHFSEEDMYSVLRNLLSVTNHRLILTVPYEQEPETLYEHKQIFTPEKLQSVGQWCLDHVDGAARMWCEECDGGLLLIERLRK